MPLPAADLAAAQALANAIKRQQGDVRELARLGVTRELRNPSRCRWGTRHTSVEA